jgi:DNA (cytosine-5)-methyltransferase 1
MEVSNVDFTEQSPIILSLCTGMRGLERGIERAIGRELRVASFVEIETFVIENLVQQMEQGVLAPAPVWSNLKTFPSQEFHGRVHGITGGYPCQPFSVAGKQLGKEDPRHLWPYIKEMVGTIRPLWCFFENVPGHLTLGYREVRSDLEQLGYTVEEGIFSAEEAGAPHQRKRLFILAVDNAHRERLKQEYQIQARRNTVEYAGEGELAYAKSSGHKSTINSRRRRSGLANESSGIKLANTEHDGHLTTEERSIDETRERSGDAGKNNGEQLEGCSGSELANSNKLSLQGNEREYLNKERRTEQRERQARSQSLCDRWPARPGEQQYEWEEPRTESRLGFTVDGYNYREDLLRMAGNGVVEQAAEVAWKTLWNKFL